MEDMLGAPCSLLAPLLHPGAEVAAGTCWRWWISSWKGILVRRVGYFNLALLLISSLLQTPDSIQFVQVSDWMSLALVSGLH